MQLALLVFNFLDPVLWNSEVRVDTRGDFVRIIPQQQSGAGTTEGLSRGRYGGA